MHAQLHHSRKDTDTVVARACNMLDHVAAGAIYDEYFPGCARSNTLRQDIMLIYSILFVRYGPLLKHAFNFVFTLIQPMVPLFLYWSTSIQSDAVSSPHHLCCGRGPDSTSFEARSFAEISA